VGAVLPDALGRVVPIVLDWAGSRWGAIPEALSWPWPALHEPLGATLVTALVARTFVPEQRWAAFRALWLGAFSHTLLDLLQDHHGVGYLIAAPFSLRRVELGLVGSETSVVVAWPLLAATLVVAGWRWWVRVEPAPAA
jgi:hypothetical protein